MPCDFGQEMKGGLDQITIIWCDEDLLVIDKPAGMLALPDGYDPALPHVKSVLLPSYGPLWIVHRLDRDTSGLMVLARNAAAHKDLNTQFQERTVKKIYRALVIGNPEWEQKRVEKPLKLNIGRRHRTRIDLENGKHSATIITVRERFDGYCLVDAVPETGRRHQIRVHLAGEGYPIACDSLYGNQKVMLRSDIGQRSQADSTSRDILLARTALHSSSINLDHPGDRQRCQFESQLPIDLELTLEILRDNIPDLPGK
jgi:RluA family pseudouridine synthase